MSFHELICISKTKGHCSGNHSFSWPINMNDRLWTMKVEVEKARKFICLMKTKFLCLENFPFQKQQTALRSVSVRNIFVVVEYYIRRSLNYALFWHNWNLWEGWHSKLRFGIFISWLWQFESHQLLCCQIWVFYFPTFATPYNLFWKLTTHHSKYGLQAVGSFRCCLATEITSKCGRHF